MSATPAVSIRKRGSEYGVVVNGDRIGYVKKEGSQWLARRVGSMFHAGPFRTRQDAADALVATL